MTITPEFAMALFAVALSVFAFASKRKVAQSPAPQIKNVTKYVPVPTYYPQSLVTPHYFYGNRRPRYWKPPWNRRHPGGRRRRRGRHRTLEGYAAPCI